MTQFCRMLTALIKKSWMPQNRYGIALAISSWVIVAAASAQAQGRPLAPAPGDTFKECATCPEMVVVPAGKFMMGWGVDAPNRSEDRRKGRFMMPQHEVAIGRPFAVGRFAVTFAEWDLCAEEGACNGYRPSDNGWGRERRPVVNVSWRDATAYVEWLSRKTGGKYRLPAEAEREYFTRASTITPFWWGEEPTSDQANFWNEDTDAPAQRRTVPVDSFKPNAWGLYQVHGNVWEWTDDCPPENNYNGAPGDGSAWRGDPASCLFNTIVRGGSFATHFLSLDAGFRRREDGDVRDKAIGFRVVRTLDP